MPTEEEIKIKFTEVALQNNIQNVDKLVPLASVETLGKEWGYYKRNIDKQRREKK